MHIKNRPFYPDARQHKRKQACVLKETLRQTTYGLVVESMNNELYGTMGVTAAAFVEAESSLFSSVFQANK